MVILATRCDGVVERARERGWLGDGRDRGEEREGRGRRRRKDIVEGLLEGECGGIDGLGEG